MNRIILIISILCFSCESKQVAIDPGVSWELAQHRKQTISNIRAASDSIDIPVLRPLAGMNKEEIVRMATEIETYDISIEPYEDCCSFFVPPHPSTSANIETIRKIEKTLNLDDLYQQLISNVAVESISSYE